MNRTVNDVEICASSHEIDLFCFHFKNTIICFSYFQFCLKDNLRCSDGIDRVDGKHLGHPLCCFKQVYEVQIYANTTTVTHSMYSSWNYNFSWSGQQWTTIWSIYQWQIWWSQYGVQCRVWCGSWVSSITTFSRQSSARSESSTQVGRLMMKQT